MSYDGPSGDHASCADTDARQDYCSRSNPRPLSHPNRFTDLRPRATVCAPKLVTACGEENLHRYVAVPPDVDASCRVGSARVVDERSLTDTKVPTSDPNGWRYRGSLDLCGLFAFEGVGGSRGS